MLASEVIDRTYLEWLYPAGVDRPAFDFLSGAMSASASTFLVQGRVQSIPPDSVVEIDDELILLSGFSGAQATVAERGYLDTTAASHADGAQVRIDPKYPRKTLFNALRSVIGLLYTYGLYVRATESSLTYTTRDALTLPAGAKRILSIVVRSTGSHEVYRRLAMEGRDWVLYPEFTPPKFHIRRGGAEGASMTVVYTKDFGIPSSPADDLDALGVPATLQPYLPLAVAGYVLQSKEIPRVQVEEIRRMLAAQGIQVGAALNVGQAMLRAFRFEYVAAERRRLVEQDPPTFAWARTE